MKTRLLLPLTLLFLTVNVPAATQSSALLDELKKAYQDSTLFEADFVQEKQVKFMSKPLISEGRIRFARDVGLQWIIKKPLYSLTRVNDKGIFKSNDYFTNRPVKDPQMQVVADIMSELLSSRLDQVEQRFSISDKVNTENKQWSVDLLPTSGTLQKVIKKIEIIGQDKMESEKIDDNQTDLHVPGIKQINIYDADSNVSYITFSHIQIQTQELDPELIREF